MPISDTRGVLCGLAGFVTQSWGKGYMMQVLEAHGKAPRHRRTWFLILGAVVLVVAAAAVAYGIGKSSDGSNKGGGTTATTTVTSVATPLAVSSTTPASGTKTAASNSTISVTFSSAISLGVTTPTLSPPLAGAWVQAGPTTIRYDLAAPLIPSSSEVVTIPGGTTGMKARDGGLLPAGTSFGFTVADGSVLRLQELLAQLNFLPVSFSPSSTVAPAAKDMAEPVYGTFAWRWPNMPAELTSQWTQGLETVITKAAVEMFENQNGLTVDGLAGPQVWATLLRDVAADKVDTGPYTYVLVSKVLPENLTLYDNGVAQYTNIPVNTGAPGADTVDGSYPVFEHVTSSEMKGTNPNGTTYDDPNVPWASYFNGGDALHGFVRAQYGFPQSNGCVEMTVANAGMLWPLTPIGTLVTVVGPAS
jgi:peptidoglycan hydrolase-like protein with peptidoglycan-binding domain